MPPAMPTNNAISGENADTARSSSTPAPVLPGPASATATSQRPCSPVKVLVSYTVPRYSRRPRPPAAPSRCSITARLSTPSAVMITAVRPSGDGYSRSAPRVMPLAMV